MKSVLITVGLFETAGDIQNHMENLCTDIGNGGFSGGYVTGGDIDQIKPLLFHFIAAAYFDDWSNVQSVRSATTGHEYLKSDSGSNL